MAAKRYRIRRKDGRDYKFCRGPLHEGQWLPIENFKYRAKPRADGSKALKAWCNACEQAARNKPENPLLISGFVPLSQYLVFIHELENRLGSTEAARRSGVGKSTWARWKNGSREYAQAQSIYKVLSALREVRKTDEVRHVKSIRRGAAIRGEIEKTPVERRDFYKPTGDVDLEREKNLYVKRRATV